MGFKIIEETPTRIKIQLKETHTFMNILRKRLWEGEGVVLAAYRVIHPLTNDVELVVETDGRISPREALIKACEKIIKELEEFKEKYLEALKSSTQ